MDELPTLKKLPTLPISVILPKAAENKRVTNLVDDYAELLREERVAYLANVGFTKSVERDNRVERVSNELRLAKSDLTEFVSHRKEGLAENALYWLDRASDLLWQSTEGEVSSRTLTALRQTVLEKYHSVDSHSKVLSFAASFLKFLATTRSEPQYQAFAPYLELPKAVKERKSVIARIFTKEDIENVLRHIEQSEENGTINAQRSAQYSAFVIFGAFTGQRSLATTAKLTVGQFREALQRESRCFTSIRRKTKSEWNIMCHSTRKLLQLSML